MFDKNNKYKIYIWRYDCFGNIKSAFCCNSCTKLIKKNNFENRVFTFDNSNIISAIVDNPQVSLSWKIIHNID